MKTILIVLFFGLYTQLVAQDSIWPVTFENNKVYDIIESYDHGYLIVGGDLVAWDQGYGMIKKTDINGVMLWQVNIDYIPPYNGTSVSAISVAIDGGYIVSGFTRKFGFGRPFIIKFNKCFEQEWSKIFENNDYQINSANEIYQLESGNYLVRIGGGSTEYKSIWVYKLSPKGHIIWKKYYADEWEPGPWSNELASDFVPDNNGNFIITGEYYMAQPGYDPNDLWLRPMFIKIDTAGNELWHLVYGQSDFYVGLTMGTDVSTGGTIYSTGWQGGISTPGRPPVVYRLNSAGDTLIYGHLPYESDSVVTGRADDVSVMNDTALFIVGGWGDVYDSSFYYAYKTDTLCNVVKRTLLNNHEYYRGRSLVTYDNKYVVSSYLVNDANTDLNIHFWKLNSNLEFDTLYTQTYNYDSLCPYAIVSDTIILDTTMVEIVELADDFKTFSVFPNPAKNKVRLEINIVKMKVRELVVVNLQGQQVYNATISPGRANHNIDVSGWEEGLYVFRLFEDKGLVQTEKVMVVR